MTRTMRTLGVCLLVAMVAGPVLADSIDEAEKQLVEAQKNLKSLTGKMKMTQEMSMPGGGGVKSDSTGVWEWARQGEKVLSRMDITTKGVTNMGGQQMPMDSSMSMISDGDFTYTVADQGGMKRAIKSKVDPNQTGDVAEMFKSIRETSNLTRLPDAKASGFDCIVIESTPKQPSGNPVVKHHYYFAKDMGAMIKMQGFDQAGKTAINMEMTDLKKDVPISPDRFVFKAPEGVQVMDMTTAPTGG